MEDFETQLEADLPNIIHCLTAPKLRNDSEAEQERVMALSSALQGWSAKYGDELLDEVNEEHTQSVNNSLNSKVLLVDGLNTFIRAWTVNPTMDDNGDHIGGITGFLRD